MTPSGDSRSSTSAVTSGNGGGRSLHGRYRWGRSWRASSSTSANPRVVTRPVRAPRRSISALVATVVPCARLATDPGAMPAASNAAPIPWIIPREGSSGVDETFAVVTRPRSTTTTSVKVPPISTPIRVLIPGGKDMLEEDGLPRPPLDGGDAARPRPRAGRRPVGADRVRGGDLRAAVPAHRADRARRGAPARRIGHGGDPGLGSRPGRGDRGDRRRQRTRRRGDRGDERPHRDPGRRPGRVLDHRLSGQRDGG